MRQRQSPSQGRRPSTTASTGRLTSAAASSTQPRRRSKRDGRASNATPSLALPRRCSSITRLQSTMREEDARFSIKARSSVCEYSPKRERLLNTIHLRTKLNGPNARRSARRRQDAEPAAATRFAHGASPAVATTSRASCLVALQHFRQADGTWVAVATSGLAAQPQSIGSRIRADVELVALAHGHERRRRHRWRQWRRRD